nr:hypothetical protein [Acidimicrobiia bacterium]
AQPSPTNAPQTSGTTSGTTPRTTAAPRVYERVEGGTTVPKGLTDPRAPIPTTPLANAVFAC